MKADLQDMFACRDLRASPLAVVQAVVATRIALLYTRAGRDYLPDMAVRLRSVRAAQAVQTLADTISAIWPQTFLVRRPCCCTLAPDEALLADVAIAALHGRHGHAQAAMRDLLPGPARNRLFGDVVELIDAIRAVPVKPDGMSARD